MNLIISGVHTQAVNDHFSDDDVIEVVRDEAPIEILSDGEENEREKRNLTQYTDVMQDFHFTSVSTNLETQIEQVVETKEAEDPLLNNTSNENSEHDSQDKTLDTGKVVDNTLTNSDANENNGIEPKKDVEERLEHNIEPSTIDPLSDQPLNKMDDATAPEMNLLSN
ncbi:hypothetical protein ABMA27_001308 [Loxostege sticticalis]|uniref:Uncharacterized protein n=1 Tax=Loxostege sticticalis TaxID=481309 RepID=A0ABR3HY16_LOXSC